MKSNQIPWISYPILSNPINIPSNPIKSHQHPIKIPQKMVVQMLFQSQVFFLDSFRTQLWWRSRTLSCDQLGKYHRFSIDWESHMGVSSSSWGYPITGCCLGENPSDRKMDDATRVVVLWLRSPHHVGETIRMVASPSHHNFLIGGISTIPSRGG